MYTLVSSLSLYGSFRHILYIVATSDAEGSKAKKPRRWWRSPRLQDRSERGFFHSLMEQDESSFYKCVPCTPHSLGYSVPALTAQQGILYPAPPIIYGFCTRHSTFTRVACVHPFPPATRVVYTQLCHFTRIFCVCYCSVLSYPVICQHHIYFVPGTS